MSKTLQPSRGTRDLLENDSILFDRIVSTAADIASRYGFKGLITPIFEFTEVFKRTLGDTTDIVTKEMFTFTDKGGDDLTLRPEFTAGVVRAFISNGLHHKLPCKLFSSGPIFRHERPQKGRYRQFHQVNFEMIGIAEAFADIELITMAHQLLQTLGLRDAITLELNSLGDDESRAAYREALVAFFSKYRNDLSEDSKQRLEKNPLRILDSKDETDKKIVVDAPTLQSYYSDAARTFFNQVQEGLNASGIAFSINPKLVRGLDYYCHTAFEFTTTELGSQGTVLAGGRYDKLISMMGGPQTPAVGCAGGVERMMLMLEQREQAQQTRPVAVIPMGEAALAAIWPLVHALRQEPGLVVEIYPGNNPGKQMKKAAKNNPAFAILIGDQELVNQQIVMKDLDQSQQTAVGFSAIDIIAYLQARSKS